MRRLPFVIVSLLATIARAHAGGRFLVDCSYSHSLSDDPIGLPGLPGESHFHDFFGNVTTEADSTLESHLAGATLCEHSADTAGYWTPALFRNGVQILPEGEGPSGVNVRTRIYYSNSNLAAGTQVVVPPLDLRIIAGNPHANTEAENSKLGKEIYFGCSDNSTGKLKSPPTSCLTGIITLHVGFPNCWDGVLTHDNDTSHLKYPSNGICPATHPIPLPRIITRWEYPVGFETGDIELSSGPPYTAHGDFWQTWQQDTFAALVEECINADVDCGTVDDESYPPIPTTTTIGTTTTTSSTTTSSTTTTSTTTSSSTSTAPTTTQPSTTTTISTTTSTTATTSTSTTTSTTTQPSTTTTTSTTTPTAATTSTSTTTSTTIQPSTTTTTSTTTSTTATTTTSTSTTTQPSTTSTPTTSTTTTTAPPTLTFLPVADTYVDSKFAGKSFGSATVLKVGQPPVQQTFLRFTVSGISPSGVAGARLRLTVKPGGSAASNSGGTVHKITSNVWSELTAYAFRPAIDGPGLATQGAVTGNQVVEFDVTSAVTANGTYNFAIETAAGDGVQYQSREASTGKPQLLITPR